MQIRPATFADATAIADVHVATWRDAYRGQVPEALLDALGVSQRADFWRRILSVGHGVFVAVSETAIVGFCSTVASRDEDADPGSVAEIAALYVCPRHWRCGVAGGLCARVCEAAVAAGFSSITLWVLASNGPAIAFYQALGFARDGATKREPTPNGFAFEELRMRRNLQPARTVQGAATFAPPQSWVIPP